MLKPSKQRAGAVIRNDCNICHTTLDQTAGSVTTPAVNGAFRHPDLGDRARTDCHAGKGQYRER
jgi:hypothetical protein